ncbi:MAG: Zn-ribbon domain-containing OB-fold protein [Deltaproteobacteria bacterium]|nr:Zn-ribbon domain-containing OB-fold protein [Deltaproteobacteria bacterium]
MALSEELARIGPNATTRPFWEACLRRELRIQRCGSCGRFRHPPLPGCPHCGSAESEWPLVSGRGRIHSFTIVHHPALPFLAEAVPYNVVVVSLDDAPGARMISNLLDAEPGELRIDLPVEVWWDEAGPDVVLPCFRRAR